MAVSGGLIVGRTWPEYIMVRVIIFLMRYWPWLLLGLWLGVVALFGGEAALRPVPLLMGLYGVVEALFYFLFYLPYKWWLQTLPPYKPPPLKQAERAALLYRILDLVPDMAPFLRKWFNNAQLDDIGRENMKDWLLWALFESESTEDPEVDAELEKYIEDVEDRWGMRLPAGRGDAEPIRLCFDPVIITHRCMLYYMILNSADAVFCAYLRSTGWRYYRPAERLTFPLRPVHYLVSKTSAGLSYWCRPHRNPAKRPIVFIHGLGTGLMAYVFWLNTIPKDVGVLAVELLPVGGRVAPALPGTPELAAQIAACLHQQRQLDSAWDEFVLVGNSYGTLVMGLLLQLPDFGSRVAASVLTDPVSLLLHLPAVAFNFTRRTPRPSMRGQPGRGNEWEMWWASATEADTSYTLARRLCWRESIMFREQLMPSLESGLRRDMRSTVIIGGEDCITCPSEVASYVWSGSVHYTPADVEAWKAYHWTGRGELELVYLDGRDHGQGMMTFWPMQIVQRVIEVYCWRTR